MYNSKTLRYLSSLKVKERKRFAEFLASPIFNKSKEIEKLYQQFLKTGSLTLPKDKAAAKKFPYLLSDLNKLVESFLAHQKWEKEEVLKNRFIIEGLHEKQLGQQVARHERKLLKRAGEDSRQDSDALALIFSAEETSFRTSALQDNRGIDSQLQKLSDSLDAFYFAKKLKYTCEMINRGNVLQVSYETGFIEKMQTYIRESSFLSYPAIGIYFEVLNTLREPGNEEHYQRLKTRLLESRDLFSSDELRDMFTFAQNYCIRQLNSGRVAYLEELFTNYEYLLKEKILLVGGRLSQFDFKNIVTIALRLGKFAWVKSFISEWLSWLPPGHQSNSEIYNLARLHYSEGDHKKALKLLLNLEFTDVFYQLDSRTLLVKIYYDTGAYESFLSLYSTFRNFLNRNRKISAYQRQTYLTFLKVVKMLFDYRMFDKGNPESAARVLKESKNVADVSWLREKMEEVMR